MLSEKRRQRMPRGSRKITVVSLVRLNRAEINELINRLRNYERISSIELLDLVKKIKSHDFV